MKNKTKAIHKIAKAAGVSLVTAYRAVNAPDSVAAETRKRILAAMQERNVALPTRRSRPLRGRRKLVTQRVAFLVPRMKIQTVEQINDEMAHGINHALAPAGMEVVLHHYDYQAPHAAAALQQALDEETIVGLLVRPPANRELLLDLCRGRRVVLLGNGFADVELPTVTIDDHAGIDLAVDHLVALGHRRIAFISLVPQMLIYRRRLDAYAAALFRHGIRPDESLIKLQEAWVMSAEDTRDVCARFLGELTSLPSPPTGIVCASDSFAVGAIRALRDLSKHVPRDVSVVGFGNMYFAPIHDPPLTTIVADHRAVGEAAAHMLLNVVRGAAYTASTLVRPLLVVRESTARLM